MAIGVSIKGQQQSRSLRDSKPQNVIIHHTSSRDAIPKTPDNERRFLIVKQANYEGKRPHKNTGFRAKVKERNKQICEYYTEAKTLDECAAKFDCSVGSIRHALKTNGVVTRDRQGRLKK
jgi:hypothetical protein